MRFLWLVLGAFLGAACGTTPVPSSSAVPVPPSRLYAEEFTQPKQGLAMLVVTRDKGLRAKSCTARLFIDGTVVADLRTSEQVRLFVEEGEHNVGVVAEGVCVGGTDQSTVLVTRAKPVLLRIAAGHGEGITIEQSPY
jgi:hypothetical protein